MGRVAHHPPVAVVTDVGNPRLRVRFVLATARWADLPGNLGHRVVEPRRMPRGAPREGFSCRVVTIISRCPHSAFRTPRGCSPTSLRGQCLLRHNPGFGASLVYARAGTIIGMRVLGVNAYIKGWIGVELDRSTFVAAHIADRLTTLLSAVHDIQAVGIDMPLGLVETGRRQADLDARVFVGPRRNSVFLMPPRAVWKQKDVWYDDSGEQANQRCRQLTRYEQPTEYGLSRQTWGLRVKLREANECHATKKYPLHEVHPEVSFTAMNGQPLEHSKISWTGHITRRALLAEHGIHLPDQLGDAGKAGFDDVLDAAAAAWSAHRIATGHAGRLPTEPSPGQEDISIQY